MKHIVIRSQGSQAVQAAAKVFGVALAFAGIALALREMPNIIRYMRIERM
ncbi:MAG: hypothetical protein JST54_00175 [Deltaproteobacteria bacterium]|nr:hypothetical protein [Deltaproteobacteria bacterium]